MGIIFVLIVWACIGSVLAVIASLVFRAAAAVIVPKGTTGRAKALVRVSIFPFALLLYFGVMFILNSVLCLARGVDIGIGDTWQVPLAHGYSLNMIDEPNIGYISAPSIPAEVTGIDKLARVKTVIVGHTTPSHFSPASEADSDRFFLLCMATGSLAYYADEASMRQAALKQGVSSFTLQPTEKFYSDQRLWWIDLVSALLILALPAYFGIRLLRELVQLRRGR